MSSTHNQARREFIKQSGGIALGISLSSFVPAPGFIGEALAGQKKPSYANWEDIYRNLWKWDKVTWGSHTNQCWPTGCKFYIYARNGIVWREEQTAHTDACNSDYVDYNPLGCQKGAAFHNNLYGEERLKYPLKRVGARGEGKWQRISWDEATDAIADSILDSFQTQGSDGFVVDAPHTHSGAPAYAGGFRMSKILGGVFIDTTSDIGDTYLGIRSTFGKQMLGYSADNLLDAKLIILTCSNWSYTWPNGYHWITEARYRGAEIVVVAPDLNPTSPACDIHVPVGVGRDAALWMGVNHVIIKEKLYQADFIREQTDLPLLVRMDNQRFLSEADIEGAGKRKNQFYHYDDKQGALRKASRATLKLENGFAPALEGTFTVTLHDGQKIKVQPVFERLKTHLEDYTPERASKLSYVPVSLIFEFARKIASMRTCVYFGFSSAKHYHGDQMERSLLLTTALTGNFGKPGTGACFWAFPDDHFTYMSISEKTVAEGGMAELAAMGAAFNAKVMAMDPDATDEIANILLEQALSEEIGIVPASFWLYNHCGYDQYYNNESWADPTFKRSFGKALREAIDKGWWNKSHMRPALDKIPQVLMILSCNPLRRKRSGAKMYPEHLFPKLKMIFALETRMSASAMFADVVLPCAWYYEKHDVSMAMVGNPFYTYIDRAVEPPGECKEEWAALSMIMKKVSERSKARGMVDFVDPAGRHQRYDELWNRYTMRGQVLTNEDCLKQMVQVNEITGVFPKGYTYEKLRKDGQVRIHGLGAGVSSYAAANEFDPKKPFFPLRWHVDNKKVFPTETRRAQFYIDHEWYLEAGEALAGYKDPPKIGGDHPFAITGGHPRHSIHSTHLANAHLSRLSRAQPVMHMHPSEAAALGIADGDMAVVYNDVAEFSIMVRPAPNVQPKQVIVYMWENYQHKGWMPHDVLLVGMPKALLLAGGYEQFRFFVNNGSPPPATDRGVRVSIRKA